MSTLSLLIISSLSLVSAFAPASRGFGESIYTTFFATSSLFCGDVDIRQHPKSRTYLDDVQLQIRERFSDMGTCRDLNVQR